MEEEKVEPKKYGTILGVFTPSVLTILGAIMYLRFGWVVGNAGLVSALAIVIIANSITLVTAFLFPLWPHLNGLVSVAHII